MRYLILFFFICGTLLGQSNLTLYQLPTKTSIGSDDYLMMYDNGLSTTNKITFGNLSAALSSTLSLGASDNYTWTGTHNFTSEIQLPSSLAATLSNGIGFESGLFKWVESGALKTAADRAWVLEMISDSGVAVDTNSFALVDGNNTMTGNNTFSGTDVFSALKIGSTTNLGNLKIPNYSTGSPSSITGAFYYDQTNDRLRVYDGAWKTFLDSTGTQALFQTGSFLPSSGTITGVTPQITFATGNYGLIFNTNNILQLPYYASYTTIGSYRLGYTTGSKLYFGTNRIPDVSLTQAMIDSTLSSDAPPDSTGGSAIVDWTNKNYISAYYGGEESPITLTVSGYASGWTTFVIDDQGEAVTLTISGVTIEWIGGVTPTFDDNKTYEVTLKYLTGTRCLGSYAWYD